MFGLNKLFQRAEPANENRASGSGFTAEIMAARESWISGARGVAELTGTAQACISLWEGGLSIADVTGGGGYLDKRTLAMAARSLALRGEAVFLIDTQRLIPAVDWEVSTRNGLPTAYKVNVSEAGGGYTRTALAAEVLHFRIGVDVAAPWYGQAPLKRASLSAALLNAVETALAETYETMPLGSQIVPFPEAQESDRETLGRGFRGKRGRVLLRESVHVSAAGGPAPSQDWKPQDVTPNLEKAMPAEMLEAGRSSIAAAFGVLPALFDMKTQGAFVREAQRHLATWMLTPIAEMIAEEASEKLGESVTLDVMRPLQAFDAGGRARAASTMISALAEAKAAGLLPSEIQGALRLVDWSDTENAQAGT